MKINILIVEIIFLLGGFLQAQENFSMLSKWVHPGNDAIKENGYQGAQTCTMCHNDA